MCGFMRVYNDTHYTNGRENGRCTPQELVIFGASEMRGSRFALNLFKWTSIPMYVCLADRI
jgi:hypothetical protein